MKRRLVMRLMENDFTKQFLANLVLYGENKLDENSLSVQVAKFNLNDHYFKGLRKTRINEYMSDGFIVSIKICVEQRRTNSNTHKILNLLLTSHLQFQLSQNTLVIFLSFLFLLSSYY